MTFYPCFSVDTWTMNTTHQIKILWVESSNIINYTNQKRGIYFSCPSTIGGIIQFKILVLFWILKPSVSWNFNKIVCQCLFLRGHSGRAIIQVEMELIQVEMELIRVNWLKSVNKSALIWSQITFDVCH